MSMRVPAERTVSGQIPSNAAGAEPDEPVSPLTVLGATFDRVTPRVLSIGTVGSGGAPFFPPTDNRKFWSGIMARETQTLATLTFGATTSRWNEARDAWAYAAGLLEYGVGGVAHRLYFDWLPGTYQLPPVDALALSVLPYGNWGGQPHATFVGATSIGTFDNAHPFTVSQRLTLQPEPLGAGEVYAAHVPAHARSYELHVKATSPAPSGPVMSEFDGGASAFVADNQPQGLLPVDGFAFRLRNLSSAAQSALVRFYIAP